MGSLSIGHWIVVLAVVILVFGAGKIPVAMADIARGLKIFRREMTDDAGATSGKPADPDSAGPAPTATASREAGR